MSVSVSAGATVIESPVWMPIGSTFSMEQTMMALSALSRTTSISNSFQPSTDSSTRISPAGEASMPPRGESHELLAVVGDAAAGAAQGVGGPNDGRQPHQVERLASLVERARDAALRAFQPDLSHRFAEGLAVLRNLDRRPRGADQVHAVARERAVVGERQATCSTRSCPPMVGSRASGFSAAMIRATMAGVIGST